MQLTPTVISAQPLEKAIREYLERHDHLGLEHFLSTKGRWISLTLLIAFRRRAEMRCSRCCLHQRRPQSCLKWRRNQKVTAAIPASRAKARINHPSANGRSDAAIDRGV